MPNPHDNWLPYKAGRTKKSDRATYEAAMAGDSLVVHSPTKQQAEHACERIKKLGATGEFPRLFAGKGRIVFTWNEKNGAQRMRQIFERFDDWRFDADGDWP